jgi:hypothetical protein
MTGAGGDADQHHHPGSEDHGDRLPVTSGALSLGQATALIEALRTEELLAEAEQSAHGVRHLTVQHSDSDSPDDDRRCQQLSDWAWDHLDQARICTRSTNDTTTWLIEGDHAESLVNELELLAIDLNPGWRGIRWSAR